MSHPCLQDSDEALARQARTLEQVGFSDFRHPAAEQLPHRHPERLALAKPDAIVMHPGPMNRGVEIADAVADGPHPERKTAGARQGVAGRKGNDFRPLGHCVDEKAIINAAVGLLATGGSTNHAIHIPAIARAAGIIIDWEDLDQLSSAVPLIARVYPNGSGDVNHFHAAGGMAFLIKELLDAGLLHEDVNTVAGFGLRRYTQEPKLLDGELRWVDGPTVSLDTEVLTSVATPFQNNGGLKLLKGNLGRAVIKVSAVQPQHRVVEAPAVVIDDQNKLDALFKSGALDRDCVVVVKGQGPKANGMPELHKLTPLLGSLQDKGFKVALMTDGRMSGASGKVPAAIHLTPEAIDGGLIAKVQDGDLIRVDALTGELSLLVSDTVLAARTAAEIDLRHSRYGMGRELFGALRSNLSSPETGARSTSAIDELY